MFTGLIEELGSFVSSAGERFRFAANQVLEETKWYMPYVPPTLACKMWLLNKSYSGSKSGSLRLFQLVGGIHP